MSGEHPIDFVIPWVNGGDPEWAAERARYTHSKMDTTEVLSRYRDWNNLQYWFRGVQKFAPWVNKIHFITWGHLPSWLDTAHPKLNIVRHEDYIPAEYLPTFSANPIELNLHRIEGLAEHFVYFNDDTFIIRPVPPEFFFRGGLPCDQACLDYVSSTDHDLFPHILLNDIDMLNRSFSKRETIRKNRAKWYSPRYGAGGILRNLLLSWTKNFSGIKWYHLPQAFLKSTYVEAWERDPETLGQTCSHRVRDYTDVNQYALRYRQLAEGRFYPVNMSACGQAFHLPDDAEALMHAMSTRPVPMICVNDTEKCDDFTGLRDSVIRAFDLLLPEKSEFEL